MLARLTLGFFLLACGAMVAACSSTTATPSSGGVPGIGPNFATNAVYIANTTGETISIFGPSPAASASPAYAIGGTSTTMNGPQYLSFDSSKHLFVTNYNAAQGTSSVIEFAKYATGNVIPLGGFTLSPSVHPRGIGQLSNGEFVFAATNSGGFYPNDLYVYSTAGLLFDIAGSNTQLNDPVGVAVDSSNAIYVANNGAPSVTEYVLPTPSPTPSGSPSPTPSPTPTPSPSPTPTATPIGATPSPTPSPSATPTPPADNLAPATTIDSASFASPMGVAVDTAGNLYVADNGQPTPRILVFDAPFGAGTVTLVPTRTITSSALVNPVDVKVDSGGTIYVVDQGPGPSGTSKLLIFAANASGNSTPETAIPLPGTDTGIALSP